jgi:hypothetical protein
MTMMLGLEASWACAHGAAQAARIVMIRVLGWWWLGMVIEYGTFRDFLSLNQFMLQELKIPAPPSR